VEALGAGSADHEAEAYSKRTLRSIPTNDNDVFSYINTDLQTVFYFPNQRLSTYQIISIPGAVEDQFTEAELAFWDVFDVLESPLTLKTMTPSISVGSLTLSPFLIAN
jgi:hypothetical protein